MFYAFSKVTPQLPEDATTHAREAEMHQCGSEVRSSCIHAVRTPGFVNKGLRQLGLGTLRGF